MEYLALPELEKWMTFYYQNPRPELTPKAIATMSKEGYLSEKTTQEPMMFFLSFIFRSHPTKIAEWLSQLPTLPHLEQQVIIYAVWLSNTEQSLDYLRDLYQISEPDIQEVIAAQVHKSPPELEDIPIAHPSGLDALWSAFTATGKAKYVIRIISTLSHQNSQSDLVHQVIRQAAIWSLKANANIHPRVKSICTEQLKQQTGDVASILQQIIS